MNLILRKEKHCRANWLLLLGVLGEDELILGIWGAKAKYFQGVEDFFPRIWGDQCIIFRKQGSTDTPLPEGLNIE